MFKFSAPPSAVAHTVTAKRKDTGPTNIMVDPRIRRGTTARFNKLSTNTTGGDGQAQTKRRRRKPKRQPAWKAEPRPFDYEETPEEHEEIDLTPFLEEHKESVEVAAVGTQTDAFMPEPPPAPYLPEATGVEVGVQVVGEELFDFNTEVDPLLSVLASKTLEQALLEVQEEDELAALYARRHALTLGQTAEDEAVKELERQARELWKKRRAQKEAARAARKQRVEAAAKVGAVALGRNGARAALKAVLGDLRKRRAFEDPIEREVQQTFLPGILAAALGPRLEQAGSARAVVDDVIRAALERQRAQQAEADAARKAAAKERARRKKYNVEIVVEGGARFPGRVVRVGPIPMARADTVGDVEARIRTWLQRHSSEESSEVIRGRILRLACGEELLDPESTLDAFGSAQLRTLRLANLPDPDAQEEDEDEDGEGEEDEEDDDDE